MPLDEQVKELLKEERQLIGLISKTWCEWGKQLNNPSNLQELLENMNPDVIKEQDRLRARLVEVKETIDNITRLVQKRKIF